MAISLGPVRDLGTGHAISPVVAAALCIKPRGLLTPIPIMRFARVLRRDIDAVNNAHSFGPPPSSQQSLQIGEAAGVAELLDVMKRCRPQRFLPSSIGQGTFQSTMVMWGSMLLAAYLAGLELEPLRYAATLIPRATSL